MRKLFSLVLVVFLFASQANSAIIYYNMEITLNDNFSWDINDDGNADVNFQFIPFGGFSFVLVSNSEFISTSSEFFDLETLGQNYSVAENLTQNYEWVAPNGQALFADLGFTLRNFTLETPGYLGIRFDHNDNGTKDRFAWAKLTFSDNPEGIIIHEWAYEDSGNPILVGDTGLNNVIPEASSLSLFLLAFAGLAKRRKG